MITSPHVSQHTNESGIALFIAIIFSSVVLLVGVTMASFGYKQVILSSSSVSSQKAYYAADSVLECALYADQQQSAFATGSTAKGIDCAGGYNTFTSQIVNNYHKYTINNIKNAGVDVCANVVVYKKISTPYTTYIFSTGFYNVDKNSCSVNTHTTVRGVSIKYGS